MREVWSICVAALALLSAPLAAQETQVGEEGFESPTASLEQMDWLVGQWVGEGIGGAPAMESWLPPAGGTMVGTFVQETGEGAIRFTEHLYLMQEEGTLVLRLKHFNADLTGWEEKDDMLTFRLVAIEDCAAFFNALTLRCQNPNFPDSGIVAAVRMKSGEELVFRFDAFGPSFPQRCPEAAATPEINACFAAVLARAEERRTLYLAEAIERNSERPALAQKIVASDTAFLAYRDAECGAVLEDWIEGTIRGFMALSCRIEMTDRRTHTIWQNWLAYIDSTPPVLPEPKPTQ